MPNKKEIESIIKLIRLKDFNSAENKILNLIKIYPESFDLLNLLGLCFVSKNYIIKGIACYKSAIRIKPNFAQAYNNLGLAFKSIGKIEDATKCYENAIKFKPNFAEAHNNLGLIMMDEGKIKNAEFNFKKALEIKPGLGYVHRHLSIVTKYSKRPLHIFGFIGFLFFLSGTIINGFLTYQWMIHINNPALNFTIKKTSQLYKFLM